MSRRAAGRPATLLLVCLLLSRHAAAQDMPLPVDLQFSLFFRILSFDRNVAQRTDGGLTIAVVYQSGFRASRTAHDEAVRQRPPAATDYEVRFVSLDLDATPDLAAALGAARADAMYVTPLRAFAVRDLATVSRRRQVLTLTGVPEYVEAGLAVGVGQRGERPEILVNRSAAQAEGADFSAHLLRLARVW